MTDLGFGGKGLAVTALITAMSVAGFTQAGVTDQDILNDQMTVGDVVSNGMGMRGQRYSALAKVNAETVQDSISAK